MTASAASFHASLSISSQRYNNHNPLVEHRKTRNALILIKSSSDKVLDANNKMQLSRSCIVMIAE